MKNTIKFILWLFIGVTIAGSLTAHPVIWKNGRVTQFDNHKIISNLNVHFSLNNRWSVGILGTRFNQLDETFMQVQSNFLLQRWNMPHSQANIYLLGSYGFSLNQNNQDLLRIGFQSDWEDQRWYTMVKFLHFGAQQSQSLLNARVGIAPYIGEFNDLHTWLMLQVDRHELKNKVTWSAMPLIRLFKHQWLVEFGTNFDDNHLVTVMIHY